MHLEDKQTKDESGKGWSFGAHVSIDIPIPNTPVTVGGGISGNHSEESSDSTEAQEFSFRYDAWGARIRTWVKPRSSSSSMSRSNGFCASDCL